MASKGDTKDEIIVIQENMINILESLIKERDIEIKALEKKLETAFGEGQRLLTEIKKAFNIPD